MSQVDLAIQDDLQAVADLCCAALSEIGESDIDELKVLDFIITNWMHAPCFVLRDKEIIGFAGFYLSQAFFNSKMLMRDYMFFILPKYRNTDNLRVLCEAARHFAASKKIQLVIEYKGGDKTSERARLMQKMGFKVEGLIGVAHG